MATKIKQSKIKAVNKTFSNDVALNDVLLEDNSPKADLVNGKVPERQLPSYVDDVLEGYLDNVHDKFFANYDSINDVYSDQYPSEKGKIYVDLSNNKTYRWSGSMFVQVGPEGDIVLANPTLAGTESNLEGLQIGNTKYKVNNPHLYLHHYAFRLGTNYFIIQMQCLSTRSTLCTTMSELHDMIEVTAGTNHFYDALDKIVSYNIGATTLTQYADCTATEIVMFMESFIINSNNAMLFMRTYDTADNTYNRRSVTINNIYAAGCGIKQLF